MLAGTLAADEGAPLLVVRAEAVPAPVIAYLIGHADTLEGITIVGNESSVSSAVEQLIRSLI